MFLVKDTKPPSVNQGASTLPDKGQKHTNMTPDMLRYQVSDPCVITRTTGKVFLIGINRPARRNCVNLSTAQDLFDAFQTFEKDDALRVAILHGIGGTFCAGFDLSELATFDKTSFTQQDAASMADRGPMGPSRMAFKKPVIAAVSGYAVAGGLELSLMCDMRVAEKSAIFGVFCRRFGVPLIDGGTVRLPQLIGLSRAMDMILTGRGVGADEAFQMGLANRVVPNGTALEEATRLAESIAEFPQECMVRDRTSAYYSCYDAKSIRDALTFEHDNAMHVIKQESIGGAQRFVSGVGKSGSFESFKPGSKL